ncbi:MAG: alpha/beta fold hydrolase [Myxococcales bacterium]|nr:alpha/beta fold hydrolase [Myxococcales bacterium]
MCASPNGLMTTRASSRPVVLVHGIWDSSTRLEPLRAGLASRGLAKATAIDLLPNDGRAVIPLLAAQVAHAVDQAIATVDGDDRRVDVVGFSMGALVTRYYLQRGGGRSRVRRFVSISGPHHGTLNALALPLAGVRQMRPNSDLLRDLATDSDPWGPVEVHTVWTPYDLMILPARSSKLPGARSERVIPVKMHRWMITDPRVLDHVANLLLT